VQSVLGPEVLERTGLRAAMAYLRIAASPESIDPADIVEILRRPTRGLPQWFPDRLHRRSAWHLHELRGIGPTLSDKERPKLDRLVDDLEIVCDAGREGTTRHVLVAVRDGVGLGSAMTLLDRTGGGQGTSHLDDLEGLLQVADLHPDVAGFEDWLRATFRREADTEGVTLSTIHRVKGREWPRVAVFGVSDGVVPHRLAGDVEEERRVLHVAITRAEHRATLLVDQTRPSPFLDELAGRAPRRPAQARIARAGVVLDAADAEVEGRLKAWRSARAKADGVPAYVVLNDKHLRGIAAARPTTPAELIACDGIGPTKLENYGDEILAIVDALNTEL
jgi:DNA helicase-2/ATP-dependent DNA helicase PcrA